MQHQNAESEMANTRFKVKTDSQVYLIRPVYKKLIFLFLNQNICCGYTKELSQREITYVKTDG